MTKEIKSYKDLLLFINSLPIYQEKKDAVNLLSQSIDSMQGKNYDSNQIQSIMDKLFDNLEKILYDFFSQETEIDSFKKDNSINRIIISIHEQNNTLYATV